jgi:hypothetical protein
MYQIIQSLMVIPGGGSTERRGAVLVSAGCPTLASEPDETVREDFGAGRRMVAKEAESGGRAAEKLCTISSALSAIGPSCEKVWTS